MLFALLFLLVSSQAENASKRYPRGGASSPGIQRSVPVPIQARPIAAPARAPSHAVPQQGHPIAAPVQNFAPQQSHHGGQGPAHVQNFAPQQSHHGGQGAALPQTPVHNFVPQQQGPAPVQNFAPQQHQSQGSFAPAGGNFAGGFDDDYSLEYDDDDIGFQRPNFVGGSVAPSNNNIHAASSSVGHRRPASNVHAASHSSGGHGGHSAPSGGKFDGSHNSVRNLMRSHLNFYVFHVNISGEPQIQFRIQRSRQILWKQLRASRKSRWL